jgi:hypothetical protein
LNPESIGVALPSQGSASNAADRRDLGLRLYLVALALLAFFVATILNGALPLRLLDPTWLEGMVQLLFSQAFLPLIALMLLHLAVVLNPESLRLRKRRDRYARFALAAALGYLLLIPLHLGATWGRLNWQNASGQEQQRLQGLAVIGQLRQAITASTSHQGLAQRLAALPIRQRETSPADLALPFPQRQRNLLEGLARSEADLSRAASTPAPIPWPGLIEAALRVIPAALALAGGFAALAIGHAGRQALEEEAYFETLGRDADG